MVRVSIVAMFSVIFLVGQVVADEKADALKKDLEDLKGFWLAPVKKDGEKEVRRTLSLAKGSPLLVVREVRSEKEVMAENEKATETTALSGVEQKGDRRVMKFVDFKDAEFELEYQLKGDKLTLKGSVAGIDLTGEWLRGKGKWAESKRKPLTGHTDTIVSLAFSADGKTLATGSNDKTVRLWDVETGKEKAKLAGHEDEVYCLAFGPDDKTLITAGKDMTVRTWDLKTVKETQKLKIDSPVWGLAVTRDGKRIVAGGKDGGVTMFDAESGKALHKLDATPRSRVFHVAVSPDGKTLAVLVNLRDETDKDTGSELRFYDLETVKEKHVRKEPGKNVNITRLFSADGKRMVYTRGDIHFTMGIEKAVDAIVVDAEGDKQLARFQGGFTNFLMGAAFSPDGQTVVVICGVPRHGQFLECGNRAADQLVPAQPGRERCGDHGGGLSSVGPAGRHRRRERRHTFLGASC
jgi:hypothetical protein